MLSEGAEAQMSLADHPRVAFFFFKLLCFLSLAEQRFGAGMFECTNPSLSFILLLTYN